MSTPYEAELETIRAIMADPAKTPEHELAMAIRSAFDGLDTMVVLAANPETAALMDENRVFVGQILTRAQLIASFIMTRQPQLKVVSRG